MLMVCHHLNPAVPEDLAFAESRIRPSTIGAEDILHDLGAISIISSDAQAMGRVGEVVLRTWQTAHVMKRRRGALPGDGRADNHRVRRYVAKYTINPALAQGLAREIGSVETGKLADLVLWEPAFFGVKPHLVIKGGQIAYAQMGDANASIPTPQPILPRPMFGAIGRAPAANSFNFVAPLAIEDGLPERLRLGKRFVADRVDARGHQGRHAGERRAAAGAGRPRQLRRAHRRGAGRGDAGRRTAHGPALLPLLMAVTIRPIPGRVLMSRAALLVLADGRFPAGGHAHSGGAEAAVKAGRITGARRAWRTSAGGGCTRRGWSSAALAAAAALGVDPLALDAAADARTPSPALRVAARKLGPAADAGGAGDLAVAPNSTRWRGSSPRGRISRSCSG